MYVCACVCVLYLFADKMFYFLLLLHVSLVAHQAHVVFSVFVPDLVIVVTRSVVFYNFIESVFFQERIQCVPTTQTVVRYDGGVSRRWCVVCKCVYYTHPRACGVYLLCVWCMWLWYIHIVCECKQYQYVCGHKPVN